MRVWSGMGSMLCIERCRVVRRLSVVYVGSGALGVREYGGDLRVLLVRRLAFWSFVVQAAGLVGVGFGVLFKALE